MGEREAGRELDAEIAEKVMGWSTYEEYVHGMMMHGGAITRLYHGPGIPRKDRSIPSVELWSPSTDIAAAWEVVEKLHADRMQTTVMSNRSQSRCSIVQGILEISSEDAATAPLAICLAALSALAYGVPAIRGEPT